MLVPALAIVLSVLSPAAATPPPNPLDTPFARLCTDRQLSNPACKDVPGTSSAYKWLLLADACDHDDPGAASTACAAFKPLRASSEPCVVAYNHRDGQWRPLHALETTQKWAFDTDASGVPTLAVDRSDSCSTMVDHTKPLTYGVQIGKIEEKDSDFAGSLKDLAELLGSTAAASAPVLHRLNFDALKQDFAAFNELLKKDAAPLDSFEELRLQSWRLAQGLQPLADLRADVATALNAAENSESGELTPVRWSLASLGVTAWRARFETLRAWRDRAQTSLGSSTPSEGQRAALEQAQKILDRQGEVAKLVTGLAATKDRWDRFVIGNRMLTWMLAPLTSRPVTFTKDLAYALTVSADAPFAADVTPRRPKAETSVRFTSPRASLFGISAGMIVTPLAETTYKAVAGTDGKKHITAADTQTRTGQIALLVDWQPLPLWKPQTSTWPIRPAVELGAATFTKSPGVFFGGSIAIVKWLRLSYGRTWQKLSVLDGQAPGAEVADSDAIRTKDVFRGARYWSVSVSISGLPIFKNK